MRIAIVVRSLKIGGMERVAVNLSDAFSKNGHETHLIYFKEKGRVFTPNSDVRLHHYNLNKTLRLTVIGIFLNYFAKLFNTIFRKTYFFWQGLLLAPIFKYKLNQTEKKYGKFDLIIMRGHGTFESTWPLRDKRIVQVIESIFISHGSILKNFYIKCLYAQKQLVCVSNGVKEELDRILLLTNIKPKQVDVITNPLNILQIREQATEYMPNITAPYIVTVSRIDANKNLNLLIDTYAYARQHLGLTHTLVIIGDGAQRSKLQAQVNNLHIKEHVHFLGLLSNPFPWVKNADLFVFSSLSEGLGYVLLEALACHTTVISTNGKGGIKDVMKGELTSYLVNFDKIAFANRISLELKEPKKVNYDKALIDFTPESIVNEYIRLYLSQES